MKSLSVLLVLIILGAGCFTESNKPVVPVATLDGVEYFEWGPYYDAKISKMKSPVTLVGKAKTFGQWGIVLKDANGEIVTIGDLIPIANRIGSSRNVGDVIK